MTVDTAVPDSKKNLSIVTKRDRRDVIRQVREITGLDDNSINQTIEACKDPDTGRYSLEQVISLLFDDNSLRNNLQRSHSNNVPALQNSANAVSNDRSLSPSLKQRLSDSITDDVIELSPADGAQPDDELERALQLSRETMEQIIDESDVTERTKDEPAGLKNVGNTCWFNSVVQTLYTLPYFRRLILSFQWQSRLFTDDELQAVGFTEELRNLFTLMLKSPRRSINPDRAIKKFKGTRKLCRVDFSHEDCSEFATLLIDLIELAFEATGKSQLTIDNSNQEYINPMNVLVTGEVIVERTEPKNDINERTEALRQINIQMIDSGNLYDGLETLWLGSADETLIRFTQDAQAINEQRWLTRVPPILFICLNRYRFSQTTKQASKIIGPFEFYPKLYIDRYLQINKDLILAKRNAAKFLYAQLRELQNTLNNYIKYPCNDEAFSLANAIRIVYEFATGCRLNPLPPKKTDSLVLDPTVPHSSSSTSSSLLSPPRSRQQTNTIRPSQISNDELLFIQNTLPAWLTEIEAKCAHIREDICRVQAELKQLYDDPQLKKKCYNLHAVCVHEGSATLGHFWTYVYHPDREKWFRYNDNEVTQTTWDEVYEAGLGAKASSDKEERVPSAYLLVYIDADAKRLHEDYPIELNHELQRVLEDDMQLLQQQLETIKLERLYSDMKSACEKSDKQRGQVPFFSEPNSSNEKNEMSFDPEIIKPVTDVTLKLLRNHSEKILSCGIQRLFSEAVDKEIKRNTYSSNQITSDLPQTDHRLSHFITYLSANRVDNIYKQRALIDIIRLIQLSNDDIRLKILKMQAQVVCNEMRMANEQLQEYQRLLTDYKDYRSVIAAFLAGCQLMNEDKFEEAITYFCVACEYNLRLSKNCTLPMRAMDSCLLFKVRRLCFERWNAVVIDRFKNDLDYRLDTMTHQFLPCLMQLKLSSDDDQSYISEIQRLWCLLLDRIEPQRLTLLEEFLQRLLEQPIGQHYHSVSINKNNLFERYEEAVHHLYDKYPTHFAKEPTMIATPPSPVTTPMISESIQQQTNDYQPQQQPSHPNFLTQSSPFTHRTYLNPLSNTSRSSSSRPTLSQPVGVAPTSRPTGSIPIPVQIQQPINNSTSPSFSQLQFVNRLHHHQQQPSCDTNNTPTSSYPHRLLPSTRPVTGTVSGFAGFDRSSNDNSRNDNTALTKSGSISPMQQDYTNDQEQEQQTTGTRDILNRQQQFIDSSHHRRLNLSPPSPPPQP